MATIKKANEPEITPHTVVKELPLEKVIDQTLAKSNVTKKVLNAMKDKYMIPAEGGELALKENFVLKSATDKETYLIVKEERKGVRKVGIITEDLCKKGRADAISIQKLWLGKEKEILDEVAIVQDQLDKQIKIFEDEEKRLEQVEQERKDNQYNLRQTELIKMGAVIANGCLNLNDLAIEMNLIRESDEDIYQETIFARFNIQYQKNESERIALEEKKKSEEEAFKKQQEEFAEKQRKFQEEQNALAEKQQAFNNQQKELQEQKIKSRCVQLEALGMKFSFQFDAYIFDSVNVDNKTEICLLEDAEWEALLQKIKPVIEQIKVNAVAEEKKKALGNSRFDMLTAIGVANEDRDVLSELPDAEWETKYAAYKTQAEEKQKAIWEHEKKAKEEEQKLLQEEEAAKATDKEKWNLLVTMLTGTPLPEFKSNVYAKKLQIAKEKIQEISNL